MKLSSSGQTGTAAVIVVVSVALLFAGTGSVVPAGVATVAVFDRVPVAVPDSVPLTTNVADPPAPNVTVVLMLLPVPEATLQVDPIVAVQLQVTPVRVAGTVSATTALVTVAGEMLVATIV